MSQKLPMTIASVRSVGQPSPRISTDEVIEISDSDEEQEGQCRALSNGNCRRQAGQKRKSDEVAPHPKVSNGHDAKRPRTSSRNSIEDTYSLNRENSAHSTRNQVVPKRVLDENHSRISQSNLHYNQEVLRRPSNGSVAPRASVIRNAPSSPAQVGSSRAPESRDGVSTQQANPELLIRIKEEKAADHNGTRVPGVAEGSASNFEAAACKGDPDTPVVSTQRHQRRFLKPPSPRSALSKKDFHDMSLEDVDDLITKFGPHIVQNVTIKDIAGKALDEIKLPKNLKVTPQLNQKRQFKMPISEDDEVIVISDDEAVAESALQIPAEPLPETESYKLECDFEAKERFLANLQLFHDFKERKPLKRDITKVLKTRVTMKAYIANPHVSLLKANCIYKYVTSKGYLSSEQFRARREAPRRKKKAAGDGSGSKRGASKAARRVASAFGVRKSIRKRAMRFATQPQRLSRHFFTAKFKESLAKHEAEGIWTSYSVPAVTRSLNVPMIVLRRVDLEVWKTPNIETTPRDSHIARVKEYKCRWCLFHCLNIPSLREHCFDYHGKVYPTVIS